MQRAVFRLVEESAGMGELLEQGVVLSQVRYAITRHQGVLEGSGMPIPGLHRIEGTVDFQVDDEMVRLIGTPLMLRLQDGRALAVTLVSRDGRILTEGHGPGRGCSCC